jgi:hypothetical protein
VLLCRLENRMQAPPQEQKEVQLRKSRLSLHFDEPGECRAVLLCFPNRP